MTTLREKDRAHSMVSAAIFRGELRRPTICTDCVQPSQWKLHAHHEDYSRPMDVVWLCRRCHRQRHTTKRDVVSVRFSLPKSLDRAVELEKTRRDITKQALVEEALCAFLGIAPEVA